MIKAYAKSDIGKVREINQDSYYISNSLDEVQLYMLADGMGGYNGGEIASKLAIQSAKSYIENNKDVIQGFSNAIQRGIDYVKNHSDEEVAKVILDEFPDTSLEDVTEIVGRYRNNDSWFDTTYIEKENFEHIQEIMKNAGELEKTAPYEKLVTTEFAKKIR